ncbi:palmitoyltransferase [Malassezia caprae]|uniref:Palmitoyltransferase n=1 Tax=Malassezia caprae TaxID=1381934 RepID=A0AAF0E7L7_9BASI|nr:palmitoyltransferase [Malassezia caprae]
MAVAVLIFANQPGQQAVPLLSAWDLNSFSWMQRGTVQDMMAFMAKTVSERTQPTQRQSIQENTFTAHVHARPAVDGVSGVLVSDSEYPVRVAYSLLNKLLEEFLMKVPKSSWQAQAAQIAASGAIPTKGEGIIRANEFPYAQDYLARYQDPRQADTILRVQQELDDTKIVLHNTIDSVLQRGEDLDKLVEKSGSLSQQSKMFYKSARKQTPDADTLFQQRTVREIELYAVKLAHAAEEKQRAVRSLVGDSFDDLLLVSRSVVDMQSHLHALQSTLDTLQSAAQKTGDRAAERAATRYVPSPPAAPPSLGVAAAQQLVLDAPPLVRAALCTTALVQGAWALTFARRAYEFLAEPHDTHAQVAPVTEAWQDLQALQVSVRARIDAQLQATAPKVSHVLDALLAWMVLEGVQDPARAMAYWHAQQAHGAALLCTAREPLAQRLERLVVHAAASSRHTERLWRGDAFATAWHTLMRTDTSFYEAGRPTRALLSPAPLVAASFYDAMPDAVRTYSAARDSSPMDVDAALAEHMERLGAAWDALPAQLATTHDLDALLASRAALARAAQRAEATAPGVHALRVRIERVLDARLDALVQTTLARATSSFGEALTAVWNDERALGEGSARAVLWESDERAAPLQQWRTARPPCMAACVRLMEERFHGAVHTSDAASAPLQAACLALAEFVADLAPASVTQQQAVLEVCAALYTSTTFQRLASPAFYERLRAVHARVAEAWAAGHAARIVQQQRALEPSLVLLARAAYALGPSPLPAPPLLPCFVAAWPASAADHATLATLAEAATAPADWHHLRAVLAPWALHAPSPARREAPVRPGLARIAPRFVVS